MPGPPDGLGARTLPEASAGEEGDLSARALRIRQPTRGQNRFASQNPLVGASDQTPMFCLVSFEFVL